MFFTVVVPTRNRPALFKTALDSVLSQDLQGFEIIAVNDGSDETHKARYEEIEAEVSDRVRFLNLIPTEKGHGQSYVLNLGAAEASGRYLCFLDDDDEWTDQAHLSRAKTAIEASHLEVDLYFANQDAYANGEPTHRVAWLGDLESRLRPDRTADERGAFEVTIDDLLLSGGFCHLNTTVVRRDFYLEIGGLDETIRWECDRDFYLRAVDRARVILFCPHVVSRHNIPDPERGSSMTTVASDFEKRLYQIRVLDKGILFLRHAGLVSHCKRHKGYALKRIAEGLAAAGRYRKALFYGREALAVGFTFKWAAYLAWIALRALAQVRGGKPG